MSHFDAYALSPSMETILAQQDRQSSGSNEVPQFSAMRQKRLLAAVRERGAMSIRELCDYLQVSDATIRRDLTLLDKKGLLSRTHGGVVANPIVNFVLPDQARIKLHEEEKLRIGVAAIDMLEGEETVMLDAGTTAMSIALHAQSKPNCTYVTTSLGIAQVLKEQRIAQHYLVGGAYLHINDAYSGSIALATIRSLSFDVAFLCASAVDVRRRAISLGNEAYAQVQKEIVGASRKNVVVVDHSKFKASAFAQTAEFADIDTIISVEEVDESVKVAFAREELELRLV